MAQKWTNNAFSTLGGAIDNLDTSITVATNTGDRFPAVSGDDFFNVTLVNAGGDVEIVKVISRAIGSDQMTIVRGQEATVPQSWAIGDIVELRPTAASFENLSADIDDVATDVGNLQTTVSELDFNADAIGFDDGTVSFEADNVQDAIDTVAQELDNIAAANVPYDDTASGIVADNVQDAIDVAYERADTFVANDERVKTALNASGDQPTYAVRAWVNFDGVNVTIRGSGNVSSVTRTSGGRHTVNFTEPMSDTNYSAAASTDALDTSNARILSVRSYTTSSISTVVTNENGTSFTIDAGTISIQVVR